MTNGTSKSDASTLPFYDEKFHAEAVALYGQLSLESYCRHSIKLLNGPTLQNHIETSAGIRAVCNSLPVLAASPDGVMPVSLFYLVAMCEGILMPHLQPMVTLAEEKGLRGPAGKGGAFPALENAKQDLGPAITFLATHAAPMFNPHAVNVGKRIEQYDQEKLSRLRNSIAHLSFRLEVVRTDLKDAADFPAHPSASALVERGFDAFSAVMQIHNPHKRKVVDMDKSLVRYEAAIGKVLTKNSISKTFKELRDYAEALERFVFTLALAYLDASRVFGARLFSGTCASCGEGFVAVPAVESHAECPACGVRSTTTLVST